VITAVQTKVYSGIGYKYKAIKRVLKKVGYGDMFPFLEGVLNSLWIGAGLWEAHSRAAAGQDTT